MEREDTAEVRYERKRSGIVAAGTLACPDCDAPTAPDGALAITAQLTCPFCARTGPVRDFLSLATPTRPAHVVVRVSSRNVRGTYVSRARGG